MYNFIITLISHILFAQYQSPYFFCQENVNYPRSAVMCVYADTSGLKEDLGSTYNPRSLLPTDIITFR